MARFVALILVAVCLCVFLFGQSVEGKKKKGKKAPVGGKRRMHTIVRDLENNVTALWSEVKHLSQPVHVHLQRDDHVMHPKPRHLHHHDDDDEDSHDHHDHPHPDKKHDDDDEDDKKKGDDDGHHPDHKHQHDKVDDENVDEKKKMWMMKKKKMMMMKKKHAHDKHHGHHHGKNDDEEEEEEEEEWGGWEGKYGGHGGTHVHIHLHTGMEEEEEKEEHHHHEMPKAEFRYARCDVVPNSAMPFMERESIKGAFYFRQMPNQPLEIKAMLEGFEVKHLGEEDQDPKEGHKHLRGVHGHQYGDMTNGCNSLGGHMNPSGVSHGGPEAEHRHIGDFGNLEVNDDGSAVRSFTDDVASLFGLDSMLGKSMVIHAGADDLGSGHSEASRKSGNAGKRSACCVIVASPEPTFDGVNIWPKDGQLAPIKPMVPGR